MDARGISEDPERTKSFRGHSGFHPEILKELLTLALCIVKIKFLR
jgi:hypothetical protein